MRNTLKEKTDENKTLRAKVDNIVAVLIKREQTIKSIETKQKTIRQEHMSQMNTLKTRYENKHRQSLFQNETAPRKFGQLFADKVKSEEKKVNVSKGVVLARQLVGCEVEYD